MFFFTGLPDVVDRLIIVLGLGSSGHKLGSVQGPNYKYSYLYGPPPPGQAVCAGNAGLVCNSIAEPHGKVAAIGGKNTKFPNVPLSFLHLS